MDFSRALGGHFYATGIGPGAADLLTVRAVNIIKSADIIIAPRSKISDTSLALNAVKGYLNESQTILEREYPMTRENDSTVSFWDSVSAEVAKYCKAGKSVAQITLGDPLIYSTSSYLLACLSTKMAAENIHIITGVSSFQAAAAKFNEVLCLQEDRMLLMPASDLAEVEKGLDNCETLILYKAGKKLGELRELFRARGVLERAKAAFYVEQEDQALWKDMSEDFDYSGRYMTTVIVQSKRRGWES